MIAKNPKEVLQLVAQGLALLEAEQSEAATPQTLLLDLETAAEDVVDRLQTLIDDLARWQRLWVANKVDAGFDALLDDAIVPGGAYEKKRWIELRAAFLTFQAWLITPVKEGGPAPLEVLSRRYVPPKEVV